VLLIGVQGEALEDLLTVTDPGFWRMIEKRRLEATIDLETLEAQLAETRPGRPRKAQARRRPRARPKRRSGRKA
jgi:hypothetical protein